MADLIEYPKYKNQNSNYRFILVIIDCFTKYIWTVPMKFKTAQWTSEAFESVFKTFDKFPVHIVTDRGLEFYNVQVQKVFQNGPKTSPRWTQNGVNILLQLRR